MTLKQLPQKRYVFLIGSSVKHITHGRINCGVCFLKAFEFTVKENSGIHLRPAGLIALKMRSFSEEIRIFKGEMSADAKKIFEITGLNIKIGDIVRITVNGEGEARDFADIKSYLESNF